MNHKFSAMASPVSFSPQLGFAAAIQNCKDTLTEIAQSPGKNRLKVLPQIQEMNTLLESTPADLVTQFRRHISLLNNALDRSGLSTHHGNLIQLTRYADILDTFQTATANHVPALTIALPAPQTQLPVAPLPTLSTSVS